MSNSYQLQLHENGMAEVVKKLGNARIIVWTDTLNGCLAYIWRHRRLTWKR